MSFVQNIDNKEGEAVFPPTIDLSGLERGAKSYSYSRKYAVNMMANNLFLPFHAIAFKCGK